LQRAIATLYNGREIGPGFVFVRRKKDSEDTLRYDDMDDKERFCFLGFATIAAVAAIEVDFAPGSFKRITWKIMTRKRYEHAPLLKSMTSPPIWTWVYPSDAAALRTLEMRAYVVPIPFRQIVLASLRTNASSAAHRAGRRSKQEWSWSPPPSTSTMNRRTNSAIGKQVFDATAWRDEAPEQTDEKITPSLATGTASRRDRRRVWESRRANQGAEHYRRFKGGESPKDAK
jgi:hypothetical protein